MKARFLAAMVLAMVALVSAHGAQQARDPKADAALQAAIKLETIDGNLKDAIAAYAKILSTYSANRPVSAQALAHMAACYERLGTTQLDEARRAYERLVRDFGDQKDLVAQAQARLAALGGTVSASGLAVTAVWSPLMCGLSVSVSDNGRFLSTVDCRGEPRLLVHDVVTNQDRVLADQRCDESVMSRDGSQVACLWQEGKGQELRVIQVRDGSMRTLQRSATAESTWPADWSPDGASLLAQNFRESSNEWDLLLISLKDQTSNVLKTPSGKALMSTPRFSPDGRYIVYGANRIGLDGKPVVHPAHRGTLYVMPAAGGAEVALVPSGPEEMDWSPIWTPDGRHIVFSSNRSGAPNLWSVAVANGKPQGDPERLPVDIDPDENDLIGFTRDGTLYSLKSGAGHTNVFVAEIDPSTGGVVTSPKRLNQTYVGWTRGPLAWSSDGEWLAWGRYSQMWGKLVLHSMATGEDRELPETYPIVFAWFPGGQSILTPDGRTDVTTGRSQAIPGQPLPRYEGGAALSHDGKTVYYSIRDRVPDAPSRYSSALVRRELETGQERVIDQGTYSLRRIAISPDDRQVAFLAATSLRVVSAEGGQAREVFNRAANGLGWSSDGRYLLVTSNDELLSVPVAGGEPKPTGLKVGYWMSVHPDGRRIAFVPPMNEENAIVAIKNLVVGRKSER